MRRVWIVAAVLGCASSPKDREIIGMDSGVAPVDPLSWPVDEPGPFSVGYRSVDITYAPGAGVDARALRLNIWYPTDDESGLTATYTGGTDPDSMENAELADAVYSGGYPVHVHSHGYLGFGATSAFLARYFASHGWVTVAPDHAQNTLIDHVDPLPVAHFFHRPMDVSAALDALPELIPGADISTVVLSGHSFGSYTTWAAGGTAYDLDSIAQKCATGEGIEDDGCTADEEAMFAADLSDPRVVSTIPMAGTIRRGWFGSDGELGMQGPIMFFGGTEDDVGQQDQFDQMGAVDFTWVELEGGCHQTFALGTCPTLDMDLGFHVVQSLSLAFARATVLDDSDPRGAALISGEETISEIASTRRRLSR